MNLAEVRKLYDEKRGQLEFVFFWGGKNYLSNWYPANFVINGVEYWCTEQYMMAKKAEVFNDYEVLDMIMNSDSQKDIKALGRKIRNYDDDVWSSVRQQVVYEGNFAKFTQNEFLKKYIIQQKGKILVEASPYDTIWGVGMGRENPGIQNPHYWRGKNLLGFVLMAVRDDILKQRI